MVFKAGVKEAAKMIAGLDKQQQTKILEKISTVDPQMAEYLKNNMVDFEDLCYLTPGMLTDFLRKIELKDLGLALRAASPKLRDFFTSQVSKGMKREIEDELKGSLVPLERVQEAQSRIMAVALAMKDRGEIVLSKNEDEYV